MTEAASRAWRRHFSKPAADLIQLAAVSLSGCDIKDIILRCFRRRKAGRISQPTVVAVLKELAEEEERRVGALAAALAERVAKRSEGC